MSFCPQPVSIITGVPGDIVFTAATLRPSTWGHAEIGNDRRERLASIRGRLKDLDGLLSAAGGYDRVALAFERIVE